MSTRSWAIVAGILAVSACKDSGQTDSDEPVPDTDADTDTRPDTASDTDPDTDVDTDTDTDTDPDTAPMAATLTYVTTVDGAVVCDVDIALSGTPYTGDCLDCDFAFDTTATLTRDDSAAGCHLDPFLTYWEDEHDLAWSFWSRWEDLGGSSTYDYDVLGGFVDGEPFAGALGEGEASRSGDEVQWWYSRTDYRGGYPSYIADPPRYYCGTYGGAPDTVLPTATAAYGTIPCIAYTTYYAGKPYSFSSLLTVDVWSFEGGSGTVASVSVDTVSAPTTFDPYMRLLDPDGCDVIDPMGYVKGAKHTGVSYGVPYTWYDYYAFGDEDLACSFSGPTPQRCPAWEVTTVDGTYEVVVGGARGTCVEDARYALRVELDDGTTVSEPTLTLEEDDVDPWTLGPIIPGATYTYDVTGLATIR